VLTVDTALAEIRDAMDKLEAWTASVASLPGAGKRPAELEQPVVEDLSSDADGDDEDTRAPARDGRTAADVRDELRRRRDDDQDDDET
jgi:hypothetical protein